LMSVPVGEEKTKLGRGLRSVDDPNSDMKKCGGSQLSRGKLDYATTSWC
jgi:hypothetical protein